MTPITPQHPERFAHFGVGELQALVTAFAVAGAYKGAGGFGHPVWRAMADDASAALEVAATAFDESDDPSATASEPIQPPESAA